MGNTNPNSRTIKPESGTNRRSNHQSQVSIDFRRNSLSLSSRSRQSSVNSSNLLLPLSKNRRKKYASYHDLTKTNWHVSRIEQFFLPEFPVTSIFKGQNFVVLENISVGSFGQVFRIYEPSSQVYYALKVLSKSQVIKDNAVQQVKNEVSIQSAVGHHPFIVKCHYFWQNRKQLFIVTDYIEGGELFALLKTYSSLPIDLVKVYVAELAITLDFLHNAGVIYRDLKPENILLDRDGHLYLTDFGLSKWLSFGVKTNTICGTPRYMAPELIGLQPYGHAVDWWSLGVITCLMMTGQFPNSAISSKNKENTPDFKNPGALPEDVSIDRNSKDLLLRLLEIDPLKRLRSLRVLQTIAFFKGFNFENVKEKKMRPSEILQKHFPAGPPFIEQIHFENF